MKDTGFSSSFIPGFHGVWSILSNSPFVRIPAALCIRASYDNIILRVFLHVVYRYVVVLDLCVLESLAMSVGVASSGMLCCHQWETLQAC